MVKPLSTKKYQPKNIPPALVRDVIDGKEFYYRGYREVLDKTKTIEEIMGCSTLQAFIVMYLQYALTSKLGIEKYHIFSNEAGLQFSKLVKYGLDLAVFDIGDLPFADINEHYAKVAPKLVVEVDVKVDTANLSEEEFIRLKTQSLLDHGADRVIWISSKSGQVLVAKKGAEWASQSWFNEFELMDGIRVNVGEYLRNRGVPAAQ